VPYTTVSTADFSVFVGDLAADVTDYVLQETFRQFFPSVRSAKVGGRGLSAAGDVLCG
jgi:RNA recognition motif-containing protein